MASGNITKIAPVPGRLYGCYRCGEKKEWYRFNDGQSYWNCLCIRCEKSPVGEFPVPQTAEHVREDFNW